MVFKKKEKKADDDYYIKVYQEDGSITYPKISHFKPKGFKEVPPEEGYRVFKPILTDSNSVNAPYTASVQQEEPLPSFQDDKKKDQKEVIDPLMEDVKIPVYAVPNYFMVLDQIRVNQVELNKILKQIEENLRRGG